LYGHLNINLFYSNELRRFFSLFFEPWVHIKIANNTDYPVEIKSKKRKTIIPPYEVGVFITFIGPMPQESLKEKNRKGITDDIRKECGNEGSDITHNETVYHLTNDTVFDLLVNNSTYCKNGKSDNYTIDLTDVIVVAPLRGQFEK
jgi:hypothetical protein